MCIILDEISPQLHHLPFFKDKFAKKKKLLPSLSRYLAFFDNDTTDLRLFLNIHDLCRKDWARS